MDDSDDDLICFNAASFKLDSGKANLLNQSTLAIIIQTVTFSKTGKIEIMCSVQ